MESSEQDKGIQRDIEEDELLEQVLERLFGDEIVQQAALIDVAELKLTDTMTQTIAEGIRHLKRLKSDPQQQKQWLQAQGPGVRILLCLWIKDMGLVNKITPGSKIG